MGLRETLENVYHLTPDFSVGEHISQFYLGGAASELEQAILWATKAEEENISDEDVESRVTAMAENVSFAIGLLDSYRAGYADSGLTNKLYQALRPIFLKSLEAVETVHGNAGYIGVAAMLINGRLDGRLIDREHAAEQLRMSAQELPLYEEQELSEISESLVPLLDELPEGGIEVLEKARDRVYDLIERSRQYERDKTNFTASVMESLASFLER